MAESKTSPRRVSAAERRNRALQLRLAGATFQQIADTKLEPGSDRTLYKNRQRAHEAVMVALTEQAKDTAGKGAELKALELARLDSMQVGLWPATRPTKRVTCDECGHTMWREVDKDAIDRVLKIMAQRSRYLGLDATRGENDGASVGESLIANLMTAIAEGVPDDDGTAFMTGHDEDEDDEGDGAGADA